MNDDAPPPASPAPRRRRRLAVAAAVALGLGGCGYALYPALIPLVNPTTHRWQAQLLHTEIDTASALYFRELLPDFWLFRYFVADPERLRLDDFVSLRTQATALRDRARSAALAAADAQQAAGFVDVEATANAARTLLQLGEVDRACEVLEGAVSAQRGDARDLSGVSRRLLQALAEAHLRQAETRNCVGHHSPESCLYPIRGAGVHVERQPAERALELYAALAARYPDDVGYRWLGGIVAMTLAQEPAGAPRPRRGDAPFPRLTDVAVEAGLFRADAPRSGGGALLEDLDGDGHLDLVLGGYLPDDALLCYQGRGDGTFVDRTEAAGLGGQLGAFRFNQADVDNDGDLDLFVVRGGWITPGRNALLLNDGGRFRDATAAAGLGAEAEPSMAGAWADFDRDGWVDLAVASLAIPHQPGRGLRLYRNLGGGRFAEVTSALGIPELKLCSGVAWGDYDDDGDADLYVSVAFGQNFLFRNDGDRFSDVTFEAGVARPLTSFPAWFFDYDDDGRLDLFCGTFWPLLNEEVADLTGEGRPPSEAGLLRLYRNLGDGRFQDVTRAAGLGVVVSTMGANYGDLDSDGHLDVYLGTGSPYLAHLVPNRFFHNTGQGFAEATFSAGLGHLQKGHGVAFGDVDEDGDEDLLVNLGGAVPVDRFQPALFRNPGNGHHWLEVRLQGTQSNRAAIGARLTCLLPDGRRLHRVVSSGGPFGASSLRQRFGLGTAQRVARLEVAWPSGRRDVLEDLEVDRRIDLREGG